MSFENNVVIVTGGTRGIGAAVAESFLSSSARVIVTYSSDDSAASRFRETHAAFADQLEIQKFNIADADAVERFYADVDKKYESVDILVNNAGIRRDSIVGMLTEADWDAVLDTNLKGCYLMSKYAIQRMSRKRRGRIINVTSPSSRLGFPGQSNYAASKAGIIAFTSSLSKESATRNITVNCVSPGFVATDLISDLEDQTLEEYKHLIPLKRFGKPEEIAHAVLFLASPQASYITGTVLDVTGGL